MRILYPTAYFSALPINAFTVNRPLDLTLTNNYAKNNTLLAPHKIIQITKYASNADSGLSFKKEHALEQSTVRLLRLYVLPVLLVFS